MQLKKTEKAVLVKFQASLTDWTPPQLTFVHDFHTKYDSWKATQRLLQSSRGRQQISILRTQVRIACLVNKLVNNSCTCILS
jgi:hypothetical protein